MNRNKIPVIGLTGGIGSGKSLVCKFLAQHGIPIVDTDQIARDVVAPTTPGLNTVIEAFGKDYLTESGELNRQKLRELIFQQPDKKQLLESILHPLIRTEMLARIHHYQSAESQEKQPPIIVVAIPLLTEQLKGKHKPEYLDEIWVVDCSEETQLERASARDGQSRQQIQAIMQQQSTREQRLKWADRIIHNDTTQKQLEQQIQQILSEF
ncbi:dephospho-CoA kinase [Thiomicrorhabdus sp.]|uniref:dephospho-CoA kinase n=1 Tax=Thiomicrorhabdus sp. TaxID=2039724 RepID=UPI0035667C21